MRTFLDTNVFVYSFLDQSAAKKSVAAGLLRKLGWSGDGFVSLQVFKEFCNVMVHRSSKTAAEIIGATQVFDGFNFVSGSRRASACCSFLAGWTSVDAVREVLVY